LSFCWPENDCHSAISLVGEYYWISWQNSLDLLFSYMGGLGFCHGDVNEKMRPPNLNGGIAANSAPDFIEIIQVVVDRRFGLARLWGYWENS
jgi:hypothetical protein